MNFNISIRHQLNTPELPLLSVTNTIILSSHLIASSPLNHGECLQINKFAAKVPLSSIDMHLDVIGRRIQNVISTDGYSLSSLAHYVVNCVGNWAWRAVYCFKKTWILKRLYVGLIGGRIPQIETKIFSLDRRVPEIDQIRCKPVDFHDFLIVIFSQSNPKEKV